MKVFDVIVEFFDGQRLEISNVNDYGYNNSTNSYYADKNGYRQFFNKDTVKYIGRIFDLYNGKAVINNER